MKDLDTGYRRLILVCVNEREPGLAACANRGSVAIHKRIKEFVKSRGLGKVIRVSRVHCLGQCERGPTVAVFPEGAWYGGVTLDDVDEILRRHVEPAPAPDRPAD
ncbi:MAG: (2Fe-2S) ferredoxin domain-containing protein [Acidobacteria bacterium]|nr:(2Fe-2S) ferredoxin domain-containing protein [Acidobacteriota bacterium]